MMTAKRVDISQLLINLKAKTKFTYKEIEEQLGLVKGVLDYHLNHRGKQSSGRTASWEAAIALYELALRHNVTIPYKKNNEEDRA